MWGAIKRHPLVTMAFGLFFVVPILLLSAIAIAHNLPPCRAWKSDVRDEVQDRLKTLYVGGGDPKKVDAAYRNENMTYLEIVKLLEDQVGSEMKDSRPPLCL